MNTWYPNLPIQQNPVKTYHDVRDAVLQLCAPLKKYYSPGKARLILGHTGVNYHTLSSQMEAFARPLWGLVPLTRGGGETDFWPIYLDGIRNGTDPDHEEYWGKIYRNNDQRIVEMPTLALALSLVPEKIWEPLTGQQKDNLVAWLSQINEHTRPGNNWIFFFVLVHMGLKQVGAPHDPDLIEFGLEKVESFYLSDGWYADGNTDRRDYYIPFAMHFYSLLYATIMKEDDPERAEKFVKRAEEFAQDFIYWFGPDGSAIPFGRSLTYRFAQGAFWGALAYAGGRAFTYGVMKGLYLRHLRWWFQKPIYTMDGVLTIGYGYPNLIMSEHYNAPGSPYWAMKAFMPLALSEDHPFWQAEEEALPELEQTVVHEHARSILCRNENQDHVFSLTSGQFANYELTHNYAKYAKFAYSNVFGFSVSRSYFTLQQGAFDSMLALGEGDGHFRQRHRCEKHETHNDHIYSLWHPWKDVQVETWLVPDAPWHVRIHRIETRRDLVGAEGGFSIWDEGGEHDWVREDFTIEDQNQIAAVFDWGLSGLISLHGDREGRIVHTHPNTNLLWPNTVIPTLLGDLPTGVHWLVTAVLAEPGGKDETEPLWNKPPGISIEDGNLSIISSNGKDVRFVLSNWE